MSMTKGQARMTSGRIESGADRARHRLLKAVGLTDADYTGGPRIVAEESKKGVAAMRAEIQSGQSARQWIEENRTGRKWFEGQRRAERSQQIEEVGTRLRGLRSLLDPVTLTPAGEVERAAEITPVGVTVS